MGVEIADDESPNAAAFDIEIDMALEAGLYSCNIVCTDQPSFTDVGKRDESGWIGPLRVNWNYEDRQPPFFGMFGLPARSRGLIAYSESLT